MLPVQCEPTARASLSDGLSNVVPVFAFLLGIALPGVIASDLIHARGERVRTWRASPTTVALRPPPYPGIADERDKEILEGLLAGPKDEQTASYLGIPRWQVRERIALIADERGLGRGRAARRALIGSLYRRRQLMNADVEAHDRAA
jgi:hypothetical protein